MCLIGEAFGDESDQICGAVINIRRTVDKISVWTADSKDEAAIMKIGWAKRKSKKKRKKEKKNII